MQTGLDQAESILQEAWQLCETNPELVNFCGRIANLLGWILQLKWQLEEAEQWYRRALQYIEQETDSDPRDRRTSKADTMNNLGYTIRYRDLESGLQLCMDAYRLRVQERRLSHIGQSLLTLSDMHRFYGDYDHALQLAVNALDVATRTGIANDQWSANLAIGRVLWDIARHTDDPAQQTICMETAHDYLQEIYTLLETATVNNLTFAELLPAYYFLGEIAVAQQNWHKAFAYTRSGLKFARRLGDSRRVVQGLCNLIWFSYLRDDDEHSYLGYDDLLNLPEYHEIAALSTEASATSAGFQIFSGMVQLTAGATAQRDAMQTHQDSLFEKALAHYAQAYHDLACQSGSGPVLFNEMLRFLEARFDELLAVSSSQDGYYVNMLHDWCVRLEERWSTYDAITENFSQLIALVRTYRARSA
jgi:tetratricopeptide (TPR) repeat protein